MYNKILTVVYLLAAIVLFHDIFVWRTADPATASTTTSLETASARSCQLPAHTLKLAK